MPNIEVFTLTNSLNAEQVKTTNIETGAVTEPKLGAEAVAVAKIKKATTPVASGTESLTAELGTAGGTRTIIAVYNAKAEASAKVKVKHGLATEYVHVTAYKAAAKKAEERIPDNEAASTGGVVKVKIISNEEIELTLGTGAPAGKAEFFYVVTG